MSTRPLLDAIPERRSSGLLGSGSRKRRGNGPLSSIKNVLSNGTFISTGSAYDAIIIMLNSDDEAERDELTSRWRDHKLDELNFVGTVGALLTSCLSSTSTWPDVLRNGQDKPWTVRTIWFCGLVFALFSVMIASLQSMRLHRLSSHRDGLSKIRAGLARGRGEDGKLRPMKLQIVAWELSQAFLFMAVALMVAGIAVLVWVSTEYGPNKPESAGWWDDNAKMAITFTSVLAFTISVTFASLFALTGTDTNEDGEGY